MSLTKAVNEVMNRILNRVASRVETRMRILAAGGLNLPRGMFDNVLNSLNEKGLPGKKRKLRGIGGFWDAKKAEQNLVSYIYKLILSKGALQKAGKNTAGGVIYDRMFDFKNVNALVEGFDKTLASAIANVLSKVWKPEIKAGKFDFKQVKKPKELYGEALSEISKKLAETLIESNFLLNGVEAKKEEAFKAIGEKDPELAKKLQDSFNEINLDEVLWKGLAAEFSDPGTTFHSDIMKSMRNTLSVMQKYNISGFTPEGTNKGRMNKIMTDTVPLMGDGEGKEVSEDNDEKENFKISVGEFVQPAQIFNDEVVKGFIKASKQVKSPLLANDFHTDGLKALNYNRENKFESSLPKGSVSIWKDRRSFEELFPKATNEIKEKIKKATNSKTDEDLKELFFRFAADFDCNVSGLALKLFASPENQEQIQDRMNEIKKETAKANHDGDESQLTEKEIENAKFKALEEQKENVKDTLSGTIRCYVEFFKGKGSDTPSNEKLAEVEQKVDLELSSYADYAQMESRSRTVDGSISFEELSQIAFNSISKKISNGLKGTPELMAKNCIEKFNKVEN